MSNHLRPDAGAARWPFVAAGCLIVAAGLVMNEFVLGAVLTERGQITNPSSRFALALLDIVMIAVGTVLIVRRERTPWRQMLASTAATLFALLVAEGGLRVWSAAIPRDRELAAGLGWRPVANLSLDSEVPGFGRVRYHTVANGFRLYGDPATTKIKVLVLGDSFTEAAMVSDGETYYERLAAARPDLEMFAIGGGGYGTLQEYMLLDESVDAIRPDLVLLQLHPNDLINNSHALESRSTTNNNQMTRPYWEDGRVVQRFPENPRWGLLYNLARHSHLMRLLNMNVLAMRSRSAGSVEETLAADDPDVVRATEATVDLLRKMRSRAAVQVAAFSVRSADYFPFWSRAEVSERAGVTFIPGVGEAVEAAAAAGVRVTGQPVDSHWNGRGHEIAAAVLLQWLNKVIPPSRSSRDFSVDPRRSLADTPRSTPETATGSSAPRD